MRGAFEIKDHPAAVKDVSASATLAASFETAVVSFCMATLADDYDTVLGNCVWVDGLNLNSLPCVSLLFIR